MVIHRKVGVLQQADKVPYGVNAYLVDETEDIQNLPTAPLCAVGSFCLVRDTGDVYQLGVKDNEWKIIGWKAE